MTDFHREDDCITDKYGKLWKENGIMIASYNPGVIITEEVARLRTKYRKMLSNGGKVPALVYSDNIRYWTRESKKYAHSREGLEDMYAAAIVNKQPVFNILAQASFIVFPPSIPIKMFTCDKKARKWLKEMRDLREAMNNNNRNPLNI